MKILILHGPNLNMLGEREPEIYGKTTLAEVNRKIKSWTKAHGVIVRIQQANGEGELIDWIQSQRAWAQGMVFNPGAYTHYSYALRDAVAGLKFPTVEVHLTDIKNRESFRRKSVIAPVCIKQISGLGWKSYISGIETLLNYFL